jgi:hypothetical protein
MHCPFKIFQNWHLIRMYTCNKCFFFNFSFLRPLLTMSQMGLTQKVLKITFTVLFSKAHAQCPATFHWLEKITRSRDQVRVYPFLESPGKKQVDSSNRYILFCFPPLPK